MEVAQTLVRAVMRAFYTTQEILVIEALVTHSALRDDELAYLMKMNLKDLHRLCASLRDARFLTVHTRPESQDGKTRAVNRTHYFIDYRQTIDAIKWRVYKSDKDMQGSVQPADESKEYSCPRCKAQWTQLDVLDSVSADGRFTCRRCGAFLERSQEKEAPGHQQLSRMNNQFKFMTDMLQQVDRVVVPECDFDKAMLTKRPIVRAPTHEVLASVPIDLAGMGKPSAVKGLANVGPRAMHVTISDNNEQERIEERNRKERLLKENALPAWMTESSVPINSSGTSNGPTSAVASFEADPQDTDMMPAKRVKLESAEMADGGSGTMSFKMEEEEESDFEFEDVV
jgi:transcription initiation factor TFIIE subunit alpha